MEERTINTKPNLIESLDSKSTIYQKLDRDQRKKLNRAIVDRAQPTYRACYEHHRLASYGVGFSAFYRYARNLRRLATITDIAESKGQENSDPITINEAITQLLAYRLIDAGDDETADSRELLRLVRAYNISARTQKTLHDNLDRKNDAGPALRKKEADEMIKMARAHAALFRQQLKHQLIDYKNSLPDPDDDDSGISISKLYEQRFGVPDDDDDVERNRNRSCENPLSHAPEQDSHPAPSNNRQSPDQPNVPPIDSDQHAQSDQSQSPNADTCHNPNPDPNDSDTSRESLYPPDVAPRVSAVIDKIKDGWTQHNAQNVRRAKPGSAHEKTASIYANPKPTADTGSTHEGSEGACPARSVDGAQT